jgi:hypothetical protein
MSFSGLTQVESGKDLGNTLFLFQIADFMSLVNNDVDDWAALNAYLDPTGVTSKGVQYALKGVRQVSNAQHVAVGKNDRPLISGRKSSITTMTALSKQLEVVATFDDDVYRRAKEIPSDIHVAPMQLEMHDQNINAKEVMVKNWYGDGTGVQATVAAITVGTPTNQVTIEVRNAMGYRGSIRWIQVGQKLAFCAADGTKHDFEASSVSFYEVLSVDIPNNKFVIRAMTAADAAVSITGNGGGAPVAAGDRIHNFGDLAQLTAFQDLSGTDIDYDKCLYPVGLATHSEDDGRSINGLALSGQYAGTRLTLSGSPSFDPALHITQLFELLEDRNGKGEYVYPKVKVSPKMYRYALNADEDAVILQPQQRERGGKVIKVAYGEMDTEFDRSRFMPDYVVYAEPVKGKANSTMGTSLEPLQFKFSGFDFMADPETGAIFKNKLVSGARTAGWEAHMETFYAFVCLNHAAIGAIDGFAVPT